MGVIASLVSMGAASLPAQERTFHAFVDPIHGDDQVALAANPSPTSVSLPLQAHPGDPILIPGELQQAPYPFRTVTAALGWVTQFQVGPSLLPWTHPSNGQRVRNIVIHCLPGLYGPLQPGLLEEVDPTSGLPWNGESFPLVVPMDVGIQGTSALDTVFDARNYAGVPGGRTIFHLVAPNLQGHSANAQFVDSVSMRGCRTDCASPNGSAIVVDEAIPVLPVVSRPSITNCFIYGNDIGILLRRVNDFAVPAAPKIAMNTIAWNAIGVLSGGAGGAGIGVTNSIVFNNIIDPVDPGDAQPFRPDFLIGVGATVCMGADGGQPRAFEGLDATDLSLTSSNGCIHGVNFNSYPANPAVFNTGRAWPFGPVFPKSAAAIPAPRVDLAVIVGDGASGSRRGKLYVNEIMGFMWPSSNVHDFRLAPMAVPAGGVEMAVPSPLVNQGVSLGSGWLISANGAFVSTRSSLGAPDDDLATFHGWDWDCEGVGNPREARRSLGPSGAFFPESCAGLVDIGADELGELIIAGYVTNTRIFSTEHSSVAPNTGLLGLAIKVYLNVVEPGQSASTYFAPQFNVRTDAGPIFNPLGSSGSPEWFAQLGPFHNPFTTNAVPFAHTAGKSSQGSGSVTVRAALTDTDLLPGQGLPPGAPPFPAFPRSRVCDIGPHLADDISVLDPVNLRSVDYSEYDFVTWPNGPVGLSRDIFQANSWYNMASLSMMPGSNDNRFHYASRPANGAVGRLRLGMPSPPLVLYQDPMNDPIGGFPESYLFRNSSHHLGVAESPAHLYTVSGWGVGFGVAGVQPPHLPGMDWYGVRVNQELFEPDNPYWRSLGVSNNLQTYLVVYAEQQIGSFPALPGEALPRSSAQSTRSENLNRTVLQSREEIELMRRMLEEELRQWRARR